ncbi:MAG TPA: DUF2780 domain-containing protein [Burkholderiales bacterium]|jgi:hypothetical protein|nr:DUF2780 domain-containing protein [Burkholderiales bacterium]
MYRTFAFSMLMLLVALLTACETTKRQMTDLGVTTPELTKDLAKNFGVTEAQAAGGVGAMFQHAAEKLNAVDFDSIRKSTPGVDQYLKASQSALGGAKLSDIGGLEGAFKKLGLTPQMVAQFKPLVLDYVGKYSPSARSTLASVL